MGMNLKFHNLANGFALFVALIESTAISDEWLNSKFVMASKKVKSVNTTSKINQSIEDTDK